LCKDEAVSMTKEGLIALQRKVTLLRAEGKYKETIENCYSLLELGMQLKDYKSILTAYLNLAASYYCVGDIEAAFNSISSYEEICLSDGDETDKLNSCNVLFLLHEYNKDYSKAKATLEKTIALGKKLEKYNIISNAYSNYSHVSIIEQNYNEALEMAQTGLYMAQLHEPPSPILEVRVKLNIAKAHIGLENFLVSGALIDEMLSNPILDSFTREKSQCYDLQGHWYSKQHLYREAYESFTCAKTLVESYRDVYLLKQIQEERCRLCEIMGDINLGYIVQKEYISLLKEINNRELELTALKLEIKRSISYLEKKANTDQLTGIYNRDYIETTANNWLKEAGEKKESITCIVFDIDRFKSINDQYGHLWGDEVIKQVSKACSSLIRKTDLFGRFGGDEFVVILRGALLEGGMKKAEQILTAVRNLEINITGNLVSVTISAGVADNLSNSAANFNELFNAADIMLYKAKRKGRNRICIS
jgi:diguanylate cyclase (GGDEF)-like protein